PVRLHALDVAEAGSARARGAAALPAEPPDDGELHGCVDVERLQPLLPQLGAGRGCDDAAHRPAGLYDGLRLRALRLPRQGPAVRADAARPDGADDHAPDPAVPAREEADAPELAVGTDRLLRGRQPRAEYLLAAQLLP